MSAIDLDSSYARSTSPHLRVRIHARIIAFAIACAGSNVALGAGSELTASSHAIGDHFGAAIAYGGELALVGAPDHGEGSGAVFVFERTAAGSYSERQILTSDPAFAGDRFGCAIAMSDTIAVIGAPGHEALGVLDGGACVVFERAFDGEWVERQQLLASEIAKGAEFGRSVAISGDRILVGAPGANGGAGAAYVFERQPDDSWSMTANLVPASTAPGDAFGTVALDGERAIIGAPGRDVFGYSDAGGAYVFERAAGGGWVEAGQISGSVTDSDAYFGASVAVSGDRVLIGAPNEFVIPFGRCGAAYLFERTVVGTWSTKGIATSTDAVSGELFGSAVALNAEFAAVGVPAISFGASDGAGAVYVYEISEFGVFGEEQVLKLHAPKAADRFGSAVAIHGDEVIAGAPYRDALGSVDCGAAAIQRATSDFVLTIANVPVALAPSAFRRHSNSGSGKPFKLEPAVTPREYEVHLEAQGEASAVARLLRVSIAGSAQYAGSDLHGWLFDAQTPAVLADLEKSLLERIAAYADPGGLVGATFLDLDDGIIGRDELWIETDATGTARFRHVPAELAGVETLRVEWIDPSFVCDPLVVPIAVGFGGLEPLGEAPSGEWELVGTPQIGQVDVYHGRSELLDALRAAAFEYPSVQASDKTIKKLVKELAALGWSTAPDRLRVGPIAMPMGGLLVDAYGYLVVAKHRDGREADVVVSHLVTNPKQPGATALGADFSAAKAVEKRLRKLHSRQFQLLQKALESAGLLVKAEAEHLRVEMAEGQ